MIEHAAWRLLGRKQNFSISELDIDIGQSNIDIDKSINIDGTNIYPFWTPTPNVTQFINLARAVGTALKSKYPQEYHIGPALSGMDWAFFETCFAAGLLEYWNGVSLHPYRLDVYPENVVNDYFRLTLLIDRYRPANKPVVPIISGEWGYTTSIVSVHQQAMYLPRMFLTNMAMDVVMSIW